MLVKDIGLNWFHVSKGVSLGIGVILASFHKQGNKINDIVYEHYHWMIYKMLFMEELIPNLNLQIK